jgi:hypothetical protein
VILRVVIRELYILRGATMFSIRKSDSVMSSRVTSVEIVVVVIRFVDADSFCMMAAGLEVGRPGKVQQ